MNNKRWKMNYTGRVQRLEEERLAVNSWTVVRSIQVKVAKSKRVSNSISSEAIIRKLSKEPWNIYLSPNLDNVLMHINS